jgi:WD repeat-containing protein 61
MSTQQVAQKIEAHGLPIRTVAFSPDGDLLYSASEDRHVNVYDVRSGALINSFSHGNMVLSVSASADQRHFVSGCGDACVYVWDLGMQRLEAKLHSHRDMVWGVACNPSDPLGRQFVSVGDDAAIRIYE